jgi:hypothetical protein
LLQLRPLIARRPRATESMYADAESTFSFLLATVFVYWLCLAIESSLLFVKVSLFLFLSVYLVFNPTRQNDSQLAKSRYRRRTPAHQHRPYPGHFSVVRFSFFAVAFNVLNCFSYE